MRHGRRAILQHNPQINKLVFKDSIPITGVSSTRLNFFRKFLKTFARYRWSEICVLWNSIFDLPIWMCSPRSSFLARAELEGVHLSAPVSWGWKIECHLVASLENTLLGLGWCFASFSCGWMKHNSDPILESPGCLDHSNLAEDLSSHSRGSLTPNSLVSVSPLPNPL